MASKVTTSAAVQPAVGNQSRAVQVYERLRDMIRGGELKPGTRVREEDIATSMDVSRTPVREALSRLQSRGLVELSGSGLSVVQLSRPQIMELYAMRAVLEGASARFAAENASSSDIDGLRYAHSRFVGFKGKADGFAKANLAFHEAICEAAHNRYLFRMLQDLTDSLALLSSTTFAVPGRSESARDEHAAILEAIAKRNPDAAEKAARHHIQQALSARLELMFSS
jgi:DNA-binding GntR family transcriptional regulator